MRLYRERKTGRLVHAKPSSAQPGIIIYYADSDGKPKGRVLAATVEEFNERYELYRDNGNGNGAAAA